MTEENKELFTLEQKKQLSEILSEQQIHFLNNVISQGEATGYLLTYPSGYNFSQEHQFCWEIENALTTFAHPTSVKDKFGNWFGRLVSFQYKVVLPDSSFYQETKVSGVINDDFRNKIINGTIKITTFKHYFNRPITLVNNTIQAYVYIESTGDKFNLTGDYEIEYTLKTSVLQAANIKIKT